MSCHYATIPENVEEAQEWLATGLQGVKTGFGKRGERTSGMTTTRDVEYVRAMREGIGADKMLMIDNGIAIKWDVTDAVRRMRAMEEYDLTWVEEPLGAWDPEGYANLRAKTTTRMAYGEREWTLAGFEQVLATGTVDVVGVDPGRAEGITGFKKAAIASRPTGVRRTPMPGHRRSSQPRVSRSPSALRPASCSSSSRSATRCSTIWSPSRSSTSTAGCYPPTGPGLGIEVIDEVVDSYRSEKILG